MFSFHRPKVYRSSTGCCICKAKSSSSRFTDSKKYEEDFLECFKLIEPRQGEICNACVLLVKRWKKLPAGSDRNWRHVVDARAGPGMKSMTKFKSKNKKLSSINNNGNNDTTTATTISSSTTTDKLLLSKKKKRDFEREYSPALSDDNKSDVGLNDDMEIADVIDFMCVDNNEDDVGGHHSGGSSRTTSPRESDSEETKLVKNRRYNNKSQLNINKRRRNDSFSDVSGFLDSDYWKREEICCGTIFRGLSGEIAVDNRFLKACTARLAICKLNNNNNTKIGKDEIIVENSVTKVFSDSSSDSGYDESSNQGGVTPPSNSSSGSVVIYKKEKISVNDENEIPRENINN